MRKRLNTDISKLGKLTLKETLDKANGTKWNGDGDPKAAMRRAVHLDILSVGHRNKTGFLAEELCSHGTS